MRTKVKENGFTMIEVIVSIALLAVITVPVMMLFSGALGLLLDSSKTIELNSISRQIKVDVYNAYRENTQLYTYDDYEDFDPEDDVDDPPTAGAIGENFGVLVYDTGIIHPEYKYNIIRIPDQNGDVWDDIFLDEGQSLDDFYDSGSMQDRSEEVEDGEIVRVFFMNVPIKANEFLKIDPDDEISDIFEEGVDDIREVKCMVEVIKVDLD